MNKERRICEIFHFREDIREKTCVRVVDYADSVLRNQRRRGHFWKSLKATHRY